MRFFPTFFIGAVFSAAIPVMGVFAKERPNILFILTDDQDPFTLGAYGDTNCDTPNLDLLAEEGLTFDAAHHMGSWSGAVCRPSRTMIMTGRTVWRIPGASGPKVAAAETAEKKAKGKNRKKQGGGLNLFPADLPENTMAAIFNRAGYDTMRTCKNGNSYEDANRQFTVRKDASKRGPDDESGSKWHGDQVMDFLDAREKGKDEDPFLIYYGFSHPHDPRMGPELLVAKYGANNEGAPATPNSLAPPLPLNWLPGHPFPHGHPGLRDEVKVQGVLEKRDEATVRNEIGRNYACIENIDNQVGRVLAKLDAMGELDNTFVFFTSDHGMSVGRHGLMGKQNLYEHTWRVPFLAKGPGIEAGSRTKAMVYLLDVLPTMCDLAGIEQPESIEGESFAPVLKGESEEGRPHVFGVYCGGTKPGMRSIKTGRWKLIEYDTLDGEVRETQLFDLEKNPEEFLKEHHAGAVVKATGNQPEAHQVNLADDPKHAEKRKELEALLKQEMERLDDPYTLSGYE